MGKEEIRAQIDAMDNQILELLNRRAGLAKQTARFKKHYYDPVREKQIFDRLAGMNKGPLDNGHVSNIYREILSACRGIQRPLAVAFLGPEATFSHAAAKQRFGASIVERPCADIAMVFDEVEKETADYGVVPFENSSEGVINYTLDRFTTTTVKVCGEIYNEIALYLMSKQDSLAGVKRIFTHPKAMEQCAQWLRANAADKEVIQVASTGIAARRARHSSTSAAVAGRLAAEIYGLKILEQRVEDSRDNVTRFLVLGKQDMPRTGDDKTSVLFSVRHEPGTLYRALKAFEKHKVNLTMMQARPSRKGQWEYIFFVDLQGHQSDSNVQNAVRDMRKETIILKTMGSYPTAKRG